MKTYPCAKINLGLYVTERRPDGYHNLQTVFYPIPLCDELEVEEASGEADELTLEGIAVAGAVEENLVMRAVRLLREEGFRIPSLRIRLAKHIPSGAGLGGGSSDAAYTVVMLNRMFSLGLTEDDMERRVAVLGADCAFFVRHRPVFATGIGDKLAQIDLDLSGLWMVLVKPDDFVSTREAYAHVTPSQPDCDLAESILRPVEEWPVLLANDFEASVFPQHPVVADIRRQLYHHGAIYAAMSGSGSSVFGLFAQCPDERKLAGLAPHFVFTAEM